MPFCCHIDHSHRVVITRIIGRVSRSEAVHYQDTAGRPVDLAGYDELVDMTKVEEFITEGPAGPTLNMLATRATALDASQPARLAIVAPSDLAFGLARMYQTYRESISENRKQVCVFRELEEAAKFLGLQLAELASIESD